MNLTQRIHVLFVNSIINNPKEEKFRQFKTSNKTLAAKFFSIKEIGNILEALGFILVSNH